MGLPQLASLPQFPQQLWEGMAKAHPQFTSMGLTRKSAPLLFIYPSLITTKYKR